MVNLKIKHIYEALHEADVPAHCFITPEGIHSVCFGTYSYRLDRARYFLIELVEERLNITVYPSDKNTFLSFGKSFMFDDIPASKEVIDWFKWIKLLSEKEHYPLNFTKQVDGSFELIEEAIEELRTEISEVDFEKPSVLFSEDLLSVISEVAPDVYKEWEER